MPNENNPWNQEPQDQGSRAPVGLILWIGLMLAVGIGIWFLADLFPGQMSTGENSYLEIIRLVAILAFVSSGLVFARQIDFGEVARNISVWTGIVAIILVGYTYRAELEQVAYRIGGELVPSRAVSTDNDELVITASADGHYYVDGRANGQRVRFMVDTGASDITLSPQDASRIGIDPGELQFVKRYQTANGIVLGAPYRLYSLSIGDVAFADTPVSVNSAEMGTSLLGMSFLQRFASFEFRGDKLYLRR